MQIQVRINEEGALRNQRYAFTDKFTLFSELMQNARRAGATRIDIWYDDAQGILRVIDDGCGIDDFQKLLTFNESGWNQDVCQEERPFGIGFSKCLYSASRCVVASRNRRIDFVSDEALAKQPINVVDIAHHPYTAIELHDVCLPAVKVVEMHMKSMCSGFPVPVWFNGVELPRPHAVGSLPFAAADIGLVYLAGTGDGKYASTLVFLQGFCVIRPSYFDAGQVNVVHLDSKEFVARLPDRDKLIDEADQIKRIDVCLRSLWLQVLLRARENLGDEAFVDTFFDAMRRWRHLDLLNDIPLLPKCLCERIIGYPLQEGHETRDYVAPVERLVTRREIESGDVVLVDLDAVSGDNATSWMYAKGKGYVVCSAGSLHQDHWVQPHIRNLDEQAINVETNGEQARATLEGRWIWPDVVLCDSVSLSIGNDRVELVEEGVYYEESIFVPRGECSGEPARQASSFIDEFDNFREDHCEADCDALADLIRRLRSVDPKTTLDSLLQDLKLEKYPLLHGRTFQLKVGRGRDEHAVELVG